MANLVIAEHDNASLKGATLNTVAAAVRIGGDIHVLVAGSNCGAVAQAAAQIAGVAKVLVADAPHLADALAENVAAQVVALAGGYSHILAPATPNGKNILPRVAAVLDTQQISEIIAVESPDTFVRPIYAGNALATVKSSDAVKVITVRTTGFDAVAATGGAAAIEVVAAVADAGVSAFVSREVAKSEHRLRRARHGLGRQLQDPRTAGRQARRRHGRLARRGGRGLRAERLAGGANRQDRGAAALHRRRHLGRDPASGRDEGFEGDRGHQQGRRGTDLLGGRLRHRGRPVHHRPRTGQGTGLSFPAEPG
jgi:electron transfer flavoprotein alpha subunit